MLMFSPGGFDSRLENWSSLGLYGRIERVTSKVFLLSPADVDVSADERRRIAEAGFYAYQ